MEVGNMEDTFQRIPNSVFDNINGLKICSIFGLLNF